MDSREEKKKPIKSAWQVSAATVADGPSPEEQGGRTRTERLPRPNKPISLPFQSPICSSIILVVLFSSIFFTRLCPSVGPPLTPLLFLRSRLSPPISPTPSASHHCCLSDLVVDPLPQGSVFAGSLPPPPRTKGSLLPQNRTSHGT